MLVPLWDAIVGLLNAVPFVGGTLASVFQTILDTASGILTFVPNNLLGLNL